MISYTRTLSFLRPLFSRGLFAWGRHWNVSLVDYSKSSSVSALDNLLCGVSWDLFGWQESSWIALISFWEDSWRWVYSFFEGRMGLVNCLKKGGYWGCCWRTWGDYQGSKLIGEALMGFTTKFGIYLDRWALMRLEVESLLISWGVFQGSSEFL